jgi:hypothetical protein
MKPSLLIIVGADPRTNARTAEAIRIAAGVSAWKKCDVRLYLRGPAILSLNIYADEFVDEDHFNRYLPILKDSGHPVYVERGSRFLADLEEAVLPYEAVSDEQLAGLSTESNYVMLFE